MSESKTAVVTGGGKGIATGLAQLGYQTILVGRNKQNLEKVTQAIGSNAKVLQLPPCVKEIILESPNSIS